MTLQTARPEDSEWTVEAWRCQPNDVEKADKKSGVIEIGSEQVSMASARVCPYSTHYCQSVLSH